MTIEGRPHSTRIVRTTREVKFAIGFDDLEKIILPYLRKTYPEFRGFEDIEIELDWEQDHVAISACKESTRK